MKTMNPQIQEAQQRNMEKTTLKAQCHQIAQGQ